MLDRAAKFVSLRRFFDRAWHKLRRNSRRGAKRNIEAHYDLGNDFYKLWLDETMTYSCAWFGDGAQNLEAAQSAKYKLVLDSLGVTRGHALLEIGCGWGGLAQAAADIGANVTGITLSEEQFAFAKHASAADADLRLQDYRDVEGTFDRIASIEMIEAVGEAYWPRYFPALSDRLKPGGIAVIQAITIDPRLFPLYRRSVDFIQRHIFPGGMLPTTEIIKTASRGGGTGLQAGTEFRPRLCAHALFLARALRSRLAEDSGTWIRRALPPQMAHLFRLLRSRFSCKHHRCRIVQAGQTVMCPQVLRDEKALRFDVGGILMRNRASQRYCAAAFAVCGVWPSVSGGI